MRVRVFSPRSQLSTLARPFGFSSESIHWLPGRAAASWPRRARTARGGALESLNLPRTAPETENRQRTSLSFVLAVFSVKSQRPFCKGASFPSKEKKTSLSIGPKSNRHVGRFSIRKESKQYREPMFVEA